MRLIRSARAGSGTLLCLRPREQTSGGSSRRSRTGAIPVSTQAGKGFFRRQEVHDLIALTRVLADGRDTFALGALLRGPLVGLTESELLDIVEALPPDPSRPDRLPCLDLRTESRACPPRACPIRP